MNPDCLSRAQRFRVVRLAVCAAVFAGAGAWLVHAQTSPTPPAFRGGVDVAQLDVTVLDKDRRPVRGLTAADFTVSVDGKPRPLVGFTPMDLPPPEAPPAGWMRDVAPDVVTNTQDVQRIVAIVMDDANTGRNVPCPFAQCQPFFDPWIIGAGKHIAHDVVDHLGPNDLAAVTYTFLGRSQDLTTDRAKLSAAIDAFAPKDIPAMGPPLGCQYKGAYGCVIDTLLHVASAMPVSPPRRKVIVFLSQGINLSFDNPNDDAPAHTYAAAADMLKALQQANVTLYAFSPGGLQIVRDSRTDNLIAFAENTGGRAVVDTSAPWEGVPAMFDETSSYYLLGFDAGTPDKRTHSVRVTVNREGLEVRSRRTYVSATPDKQKPLEPVVQALGQSIPSGDLPLSVSTSVFAGASGGNATVAIASELRESFDSSPASRPVTFVATALDKDWKEKSTVRQTFTTTFRGPATGGTAPVELLSRLTLPPGRYEIRVAAESAGHTGNVFTDVEIPDFAKEPLSASGLLVSAQPDAPSLPDGAFRDLVAIVPSARRAFAPTDRASAFLRVYEGGKGALTAVTMAATIVDEADRTVSDETMTLMPGAFGTKRAADYSFDLPLSRLRPGAYLLKIDATKGTGPSHLSRTLRFTVN